MGNSNTKRSDDYGSSVIRKKSKEFVDQPINYGSLVTQGIYTAPPEYDIEVVRSFILKKKLSPFYKGMENYSDNPFPGASSSSNNQTNLAESSKHSSVLIDNNTNTNTNSNNNANNEYNNNVNGNEESSSTIQIAKRKLTKKGTNGSLDRKSRTGSFSSGKLKRNSHLNDDDNTSISSSIHSLSTSIKVDPEHPVYSKEEFFKYPIECPICFLYYPRNINYTRCCDQPICTECFIQIKRTFSNPEPTCCPFCVQPNFGVTYLSPDSEEYQRQYEILVKAKEQHDNNSEKLLSQGSTPGRKRRNSVSYTDPHIVTSDDIYPGWMLKYEQYQREQQRLEAMRIRNFNAQVNNSATVALLNAFLQLPREQTDGLRRHRNGSNIRNIGNDLEEMMLLEAIRRSLADSNNQEGQNEQNNLNITNDTNNNDNSDSSNTTTTTTNNNNNSNSNNNDTSNISITNELEEATENINIDSSSMNETEVNNTSNTSNTIDNNTTSNDNSNDPSNNNNNNNDNSDTAHDTNNENNKNEDHLQENSENNIEKDTVSNKNLDLTDNTVNDNIIDSTTSNANNDN